MNKSIERLLLMSDAEVLGLNEQAAVGVPRRPERSQFSHLLRHFLERFSTTRRLLPTATQRRA